MREKSRDSSQVQAIVALFWNENFHPKKKSLVWITGVACHLPFTFCSYMYMYTVDCTVWTTYIQLKLHTSLLKENIYIESNRIMHVNDDAQWKKCTFYREWRMTTTILLQLCQHFEIDTSYDCYESFQR